MTTKQTAGQILQAARGDIAAWKTRYGMIAPVAILARGNLAAKIDTMWDYLLLELVTQASQGELTPTIIIDDHELLTYLRTIDGTAYSEAKEKFRAEDLAVHITHRSREIDGGRSAKTIYAITVDPAEI